MDESLNNPAPVRSHRSSITTVAVVKDMLLKLTGLVQFTALLFLHFFYKPAYGLWRAVSCN